MNQQYFFPSNKRLLVIGCQGTERETGISSHKLLFEKKKSMCTYIYWLTLTLSVWIVFPDLVLTAEKRSIQSWLLKCRRPQQQPNSSELQSIPAPPGKERVDWKIVGDWFLQTLCLQLQSITSQTRLNLQRSSPVASILEPSEDLLFVPVVDLQQKSGW